MSLVVAVAVNQLRAVPRKGSKLLLCLVVVFGWFEFSRFTADVMEISLDLYMSCILDSSSCRVVSSYGDANGCCSKDLRNCCILVSCLLKSFQCHSRFPSEICAVTIQECLVGYACNTGWKITDSPGSICEVVVTGVNMSTRL